MPGDGETTVAPPAGPAAEPASQRRDQRAAGVARAPAEAAGAVPIAGGSGSDGLTASEAPLRVGAFVPFFSLPDETGQLRRIHDHGGEVTALHFLPGTEAGTHRRFFAALAQTARGAGALQRVVVLPLPQNRLRGIKRRFGVDIPLWSDADLRVCGLLGAAPGRSARHATAVSCLIGPNLQVVRMYRAGGAEQQLDELARDARALARPPRLAPAASHAPVLIIPGVLAKVECARAIERFEAGPRFAGTVGGGARARYDARNKIRTDGALPGAVVSELDRIFAQTMFPEVRKVFGFEVTHREPYKIGRYDADKGGFFYRHRDNADEEVAYRRCAVSVNLNDDYDGGEIQFPEYGGALYRPEAGAALVFPCALMHRVLRMKTGARTTLISFLFTDDDVRLWSERNGDDRLKSFSLAGS
jgi:predicted 2-oxoglutarate/Fe(II)-dependent dioxygenase YbiX/peroxiredoxin